MRKPGMLRPVMKKIVPLLFVSVLLFPLSVRCEIKAGSVEISPFAGYNFFESGQNLNNHPLFGARVGYNFTDSLGIEAAGEFINSSVADKNKSYSQEGEFTNRSDSVKVTMYHLDMVYHFMPEAKFNPFIVAGYGAAHYSPKINDQNMSLIDFGVGAKYWVTDNIALRMDVRDNLVLDNAIHNVQLALGVVFAFGGKDKAVPVPVAKVLDSDGDGVPDTLDRCSGTPVGIAVDKDGCPLDTDKDGVPDYLDKCANTPAGVAVDKDGCPPVLEKVVILVSEPKVEEKIIVAAVEPKIVVLVFEDIHFQFDKSDLTPEAKTALKKDIRILKENPNARIRVAGYTSAAGTEEYNQKLSERRAVAVREYLITEGVITKERLSTIGYGEAHPAVVEAAPKELYSAAAKANMRVLFEIIVQ
jgi:OmpA-OmpF porin, OOP family